ncbi:MAG: hypothetical protein WHS89_13550 [Acidimicrobiales bacterium]
MHVEGSGRMHLVLFETSGNQRYIFDTNKLKVNLGASELTAQAGSTWVLEAVTKLTGISAPTPTGVADHLCDRTRNPPIEQGGVAEVVVAASGKALVLVADRDRAEQLVWKVTSRALQQAPGLDICGVISEPFDWNLTSIHKVSMQLHRDLGPVRVNRGGPQLRFPGVPIGARCTTSGLPAAVLDRSAPDPVPQPRSAAVSAALAAADAGRQRMQQLLGDGVAPTIDELEAAQEHLDWLGVIHADGNGLGSVFVNFDTLLEKAGLLNGATNTAERNRAYVNSLRSFSLALNDLVVQALNDALATQVGGADRSLVPVVLGGDDVTVLCDGRRALDLAVTYLQAFERQSADPDLRDGIIPRIAQAAFGHPRLGACAGVAIVKPHYPFSAAYDLAEELTASAKQVKLHARPGDGSHRVTPCSAVDFHVLYDVAATDLKTLRERMSTDTGTTRLYTRPYVVTPPEHRPSNAWFEGRGWEHLEAKVRVLTEKDGEGRPVLPRSQIHDLRSGLFVGKDEAEFRFLLLKTRYQSAKHLADGPDDALFTDEPAAPAPLARTSLLDAMEAAEFTGLGSRSATTEPAGEDR